MLLNLRCPICKKYEIYSFKKKPVIIEFECWYCGNKEIICYEEQRRINIE